MHSIKLEFISLKLSSIIFDYSFSVIEPNKKIGVHDNLYFISQGSRVLIMSIMQLSIEHNEKLAEQKQRLIKTISDNLQFLAKIIRNDPIDVNITEEIESPKLFATCMNIIQKARDKYLSTGVVLNNEEKIILRILAGQIENLKTLSKGYLSYPIQEHVIMPGLINLASSNSLIMGKLYEIINNYPDQATAEQLKLCISSLDRCSIQIQIVGCMDCLSFNQDIPRSLFALTCRSWACFIPLTLYYMYKSLHPEQAFYI